MSKKEEKPRSEWLANRPLDKLFTEAWDHVSRSYSIRERRWEEKERPSWNKKVREAKRRGEDTHEIAILGRKLAETELQQRRNFMIHTSEFGWVAAYIDDLRLEVVALKTQLQELGVLKEQIKSTADIVKDREVIFNRIFELYGPMISKGKKTSKKLSKKQLLQYVT